MSLFFDKASDVSVTYPNIFWEDRFQQRICGQKPPDIQKDIVVIFERFVFSFKDVWVTCLGVIYFGKIKLLSNIN